MFPLGSSGGVKVTLTLFTSSGIDDTITFLGGSLGSGTQEKIILENVNNRYLIASTGWGKCQRSAEVSTYPPQAFEIQ